MSDSTSMTERSINQPAAITKLLAALDTAHQLAAQYLQTLPERPVSEAPSQAELAAALREPLPARPAEPGAVLPEWLDRAGRGIVASAGPRFFGYVNGGSLPAALAGDWLASALDQNAGMWLSSPAAAETEQIVIRWLLELFGLPADWTGTLTSGATMANLVGLAAARQWAANKLGFDAAAEGLAGHPPIAVISSTAVHASARKALGTLGLGRDQIQTVPAPDGAVDVPALAAALAQTRQPVIVIANAGDVNTGAFDDLTAVADCCAKHAPGAWLHVDGAFGLFAAVTPRLRHLTQGVERADSVAADGHKWLNVPYDCGFAFVRDGEALRGAFNASGAYLTVAPDAGEDPHRLVPEMSRRFRALAVWCAIKSLGRAGCQELIERCVNHAATFAAWVEAQAGLELLAPARLNIVCFRYAPAGLAAAATDDLNRTAVAALVADGRVFVTGTIWQGKAAVHIAFDNWLTTPADVEILCQAVQDIGVQLTAEHFS